MSYNTYENEKKIEQAALQAEPLLYVDHYHRGGGYVRETTSNNIYNPTSVSQYRQAQLEALLNMQLEFSTGESSRSRDSLSSVSATLKVRDGHCDDDDDDHDGDDVGDYDSRIYISRFMPSVFHHSSEVASGIHVYKFGEGFMCCGVIYFSMALLQIAQNIAGCTTNRIEVSEAEHDDDDDTFNFHLDCEDETKKLWGMFRPTSLLTTCAAIVSIGSSLAMPLIGSLIDHTPHRRTIGKCAASTLIALNAFGIAICEATFEFMVVGFIFAGFTFALLNCITNAYLPELKAMMDHHKNMSDFTASYSSSRFSSIALCLILVAGIIIDSGLGDIAAARVCQLIVVPTLMLCWGFAWEYLLVDRPPLHEVPEGESLLKASIKFDATTAADINKNFPDLKKFLTSLTFFTAATNSLVIIATTFMLDQLKMSSLEIGCVYFTAIVFAVPGTMLSPCFSYLINPLNSYRANICIWTITILIASLVLRGREQWQFTYVFAAILGLSYGWKYPNDMTIYTTIIPKGRESEMMGIKALSDGALVWAPCLLFTLMNEQSWGMQYSLASLALWFLASLIVSLFIKEYEKIVEHAVRYTEYYEHRAVHDTIDELLDDVEDDSVNTPVHPSYSLIG